MPETNNALTDFLAAFHHREGSACVIRAEQGSRFAKQIARDHNPLHDADGPRFCVPGDLLFALTIGHYGLAHELELTFKGMLRADTWLHFPSSPGADFSISGENDKEYVTVRRGTPLPTAPAAQVALIRAYVACSGQTFPDLLDPLLAEQSVMFNPQRPFVVYDSMRIALEQAPSAGLKLTLTASELAVDGKRGDARFTFEIIDTGKIIGRCEKQMVVSGLRPYDAETMAKLIAEYQARRAA